MPIPANTLRDTVTTLNLQGYQGNDLMVALHIQGDAPMPALVNAVASYAAGGRAFPPAMQPAVTIDGRTIYLSFTTTGSYPYTAAHAISFDGRIVLAGTLSFNRQTVGSPGVATNQSVSLTIVEGGVVDVTVLIGAGTGTPTELTNAPDFLNTYTLFKNA